MTSPLRLDATQYGSNLLEDYLGQYVDSRELEKELALARAPTSILSKFFGEMHKNPLLTKEQEGEVCLKVKAGDFDARQLLIVSNLRLVVSIAKKYRKVGVPFMDLISEGVFGLFKAAEGFDPDKGFRFTTYCYAWIEQSISRSLHNQSRTIRLPVHVHAIISKIDRILSDLNLDINNPKTAIILSRKLDIPIEKVANLIRARRQVSSLDVPLGNGENNDTTRLDLLESEQDQPDVCLQNTQTNNTLYDLVDQLPRRVREVLLRRYGLRGYDVLTLDEIAEDMNLTRQRISQLEQQGMRRIRELIQQNNIEL